MDLTPEEFDDLVGAYALDACEPDEVEAMERYVARTATPRPRSSDCARSRRDRRGGRVPASGRAARAAPRSRPRSG